MSSVACIAGALGNRALAQTVDQSDILDDVAYPPLPDVYHPTGIYPPSGDEKRIADAIIKNAHGDTPVQVARYFLSNAVDPHYRNAWPANGPWNPVILTFLNGAKAHANNDMVPWCAGFVNFCLMRSGYNDSGSASSQSFLHNAYFPEVRSPTEGDIAIFTFYEEQSGRSSGLGHVTFVLRAQPEMIHTLGGNQSGHGMHGITLADFPYSIPRPEKPPGQRCVRRGGDGHCQSHVLGRLKLNRFVRPTKPTAP